MQVLWTSSGWRFQVALGANENIKDACWLHPTNNAKHINLAELEVALKGVKQALWWQATVLNLVTNSACMHWWISDTLTRKVRMNTKAVGEMLVRQCLGTLQTLAEEYELTIDVTLVKSCQNHADCLTRVPWRWLDLYKEGGDPVPESYATMDSRLNESQMADIHQQSGQPGMKQTLYLARSVNSSDRLSKPTTQ